MWTMPPYYPDWEEPLDDAPIERDQGLGDDTRLLFGYFSVQFTPTLTDLFQYDDTNGVRGWHRDGKYHVTHPVCSPDGKRITFQKNYGNTNTLWIADADGANVVELLDQGFYVAGWSPDNRHLLGTMMHPKYQVGQPLGSTLWTTFDVETRALHPIEVPNILTAGWRADGRIVALVKTDGILFFNLYDSNGNFQQLLARAVFLVNATDFWLSPDGTKVAYTRDHMDQKVLVDPLFVASLDGSDERQVGTKWMDCHVVWSPDSRRIAFGTLGDPRGGGGKTLEVVNADGTNHRFLMLVDEGDDSGEIMPAEPAWSSDGMRLAVPSFIDTEPDEEYDPDEETYGSAIFAFKLDEQNQVVEQRRVLMSLGSIYDLIWMPSTTIDVKNSG